MVSAHVVDARLFDELPHVRLLQVLELVVVRGRQVGAHAPVVARDDDAASAGWVLVIDAVLDP